MNNIFEEFYGPSIESELTGQEGLGAVIGAITGVGLIIAGTSWIFKKLRQRAIKKMDAQTENTIYDRLRDRKSVV